MSSSEKYQKYTPLEHILKRPDSYIGSIEITTDNVWVLSQDKTKMERRAVQYVPGLYKIFDEILVNAIDQSSQDRIVDKISVSVNQAEGSISVLNTGSGIPVEIHATEKVYIPEMIFGELLTSSNYNDSEKRTVGGRNGYGAKLANIFSTRFEVETLDTKTHQKYHQSWENNMRTKSKPKIQNPRMQRVMQSSHFIQILPSLDWKVLLMTLLPCSKREYMTHVPAQLIKSAFSTTSKN